MKRHIWMSNVMMMALVMTGLIILATQGQQGITLAQAEEVEGGPIADEPVKPQPSTTDTEEAHESNKSPPTAGEEFVFEAEVSRLLDILINSLYSNKDIFLRELISNASDALDKLRLISLTDATALGSTKDLEIRISFDKQKKILSIRDSGIGMTRAELIKNLGTIAKSGTAAFLDRFKTDGDMNLIGQFGVGFYSSFLAADKVQVISKSNSDPSQNIWESSADGNFVVYEDTENEPLGRGTQLNLYLKEETSEYVEQEKLKELVQQYSEFINYPIYLLEEVEKEVEVEVEEAQSDEEEEEEEVDEDKDEEEVDEDKEEEEEEETEPETKMVKKTVTDLEWRLMNDAKAIWLRSPQEVDSEEYGKFFKTISKNMFDLDTDEVAHTHFKAEGDIEFRSVLFIPDKPPRGFRENFEANSFSRIKLFVRRVFISDDFKNMMPRYLSFIIGVVDSDTLPLNVSRESLQHHASLKTIKKKLIRKVLDMMRKMADEERKAKEELEEKTEEELEEEDEDQKHDAAALQEQSTKYTKFWKEFGSILKMGLVEDHTNRIRLAKLLRFKSSHDLYSKNDDEYTGFEGYVSRMPKDQKKIYYLAGDSVEVSSKSPFAEKLKQKGYEVIYLTEPIDEYVMQQLPEFEDIKTQNAAKDDMDLDEEDEKKKQKQLRDMFRPFTKWWKTLMPNNVDSVKLSSRLTTSPCIVVSSKYGYTAKMEKIMKAQAMNANKDLINAYRSKRILEINPFHPFIKKLKAMFEEDEDNENAKATALLMYETSLLESGFEPEDHREYAKRVYDVLHEKIGVNAEDQVVDDFVYPVEEEEGEGEQMEEAASEMDDDTLLNAENAEGTGSEDEIEQGDAADPAGEDNGAADAQDSSSEFNVEESAPIDDSTKEEL